MTSEAFCFIRNTLYDLNPFLTHDKVVNILYSSIKYEITSIIKQCNTFLMNINNINHYFIVIKSFSCYPKALFESFFMDNFTVKSRFIENNIQQIISDEKLITYSSLFEIQMFSSYILSKKLINNQQCYDIIIKWCKSQFNNKLKSLLYIKDNNQSQLMQYETSISSISNVSNGSNVSNISLMSLDYNNDFMITKWQDLFEYFLDIIDFCEMDIEYLLTNVRNDCIMTHQDLLSILLQKYEHDKTYKQKITSPLRLNTNKNNINNKINTNNELNSKSFCIGIGNKIDLRDNFGRYLKAEIIESEENNNKVKIHYIGWNSMWDKWINIQSDSHLIANFGSITDREIQKVQLQHLVIGDKVIIKLPQYHKHHKFGWISAEIIDMDKAQLNVQYKITIDERHQNMNYQFWVHADNVDECR
eukprot:257986_1